MNRISDELIKLTKEHFEYTNDIPPKCQNCLHVITRDWQYYCPAMIPNSLIEVNPDSRCNLFLL